MRIRTIKPCFFLNDTLAGCSPIARLLFIGLWCASDCEGRLEERPKRLKAEILPYDDVDVTDLLSELESGGFIYRYAGDGVRLIQVINFNKHQRITGTEAESKSSFPSRKNQETTNVSKPETITVASLDDRKEGREGKGRERNPSGLPPGGFSSNPQPDQQPVAESPTKHSKSTMPATFAEVISSQPPLPIEQPKSSPALSNLPEPAKELLRSKNPAHGEFIERWMKSFAKHHDGRQYVFNGGRDGKAVQSLCRSGYSTDTLIDAAVKAWHKVGSWECGKAVDIHGFANNLNSIFEAVSNRKPDAVNPNDPESVARYAASLSPTI